MSRDGSGTTRRGFIGAAAMAGMAGLLSSVAGAAASERAPLWRHAAEKGIVYGAACSTDTYEDDAPFRKVLLKETRLLAAENDFLWYKVRPNLETFDFSYADRLARFARSNGKLLYCTHLVWHFALAQGTEEAVRASPDPEGVMVEHIERVAGRYRGRVWAWNVVNEAVEPNDGREDGLRNTFWLDTVGTGYIETAFRAARKADPNALLVYNDYALESDARRREACLRLLDRLLSAGAPIDALGTQSHLGLWSLPLDAGYKTFLRRVGEMGLKIVVSELDVVDVGAPSEPARRDRAVARVYREYLDLVLRERAVDAVITWGLSDRYSWLADPSLAPWAQREDGLPPRPLPLGPALGRKPAWRATAGAFDDARRRMGSRDDS